MFCLIKVEFWCPIFSKIGRFSQLTFYSTIFESCRNFSSEFVGLLPDLHWSPAINNWQTCCRGSGRTIYNLGPGCCRDFSLKDLLVVVVFGIVVLVVGSGKKQMQLIKQFTYICFGGYFCRTLRQTFFFSCL